MIDKLNKLTRSQLRELRNRLSDYASEASADKEKLANNVENANEYYLAKGKYQAYVTARSALNAIVEF